jgi:hypothetical protein
MYALQNNTRPLPGIVCLVAGDYAGSFYLNFNSSYPEIM